MLIVISMIKNLLEHFMKKSYKRQRATTRIYKKLLRKKVINYMLNEKVLIVHLIARLIKEN